MKREDAEEYTQSLGQVVAGGYRQIMLGKRLGVPQALDLSVEQWVEQRLGGYVRLSISDRRQAVVELTNEGLSQREIGEVLGVGKATVGRDQRNDSNESQSESQSAVSENEIDSNESPEDNADRERSAKEYEEAESKRRLRALHTEWICGLQVFDPRDGDPKVKAKEMLENFNYKAAGVAVDLSRRRYLKIAAVIAEIARGFKK